MRQDMLSDLRPYANIILQHMPVRMGLHDARDLCLLEANASYLEMLKEFIGPDEYAGELIGHRLSDWGSSKPIQGLIPIYRHVAETGEVHRSQPIVCTSLGRTTYWIWNIAPIRREDGAILYVLATGVEVTDPVREQQSAEERRETLSKTNQELREEKLRLEVVEIIARCVEEAQGDLNEHHDTETMHIIKRISEVAVETFRTYFSPTLVCQYIADSRQQVLRLWSAWTASHGNYPYNHSVPYEGGLFGTDVYTLSDPFLIEDLPAAVARGEIEPDENLALLKQVRGLLCLPLWSEDYLEGMLGVGFDHPISKSDLEVRTLGDCGKYIASALAAVRKHNEVKHRYVWLRELLQKLPESIMIVEVADGHINYANPAAYELLGIPERDLVGLILHDHPSAQLTSEAVRYGLAIEPWNFAIVRALGGEILRNEETLLMRRDGTTVIVQMSSAPLWLADGVAKEVVIVLQDVTEQKILERQKNEFLSMVNHELRTPLTVIQGFAEILPHILEREQPLNDLMHTAVSNIVEQSEHLVRLIEEMLDISRIEHEQFILQRGRHDLLRTLREIIYNQSVTTKKHTICLVLDGVREEEPLVGVFDEKRIKQVLYNLVGNAIKYSPGGGEIQVGLRYIPHKEHEVLIWIKDQGIGIAEDDLPHIFKRFHRVNNQDRSPSGLGIGLYLVKEVITQHGGHVWVRSAEGVGSTFFVTLPLCPVDI